MVWSFRRCGRGAYDGYAVRRTAIYFYLVVLLALALSSSLALIDGPPRIFAALLIPTFLLIGSSFPIRRVRWLWLLPVGLAAFFASLAVDEWFYLTWTMQSEATLNALTASMQSPTSQYFTGRITVAPSGYLVQPQQQLLLHFEPPLLAWTYHLGKLRAARPCLDRIFSALRTAFWSPGSSWEMEELVTTHTPWIIGVMRCPIIAACRGRTSDQWIIYADHGHGI
jgi:hypothetical protein